MLKVSFRRSLSMYKVVRTADIRGYWLVYVPKKNYFFRELQQVATSRTTSYMLKKRRHWTATSTAVTLEGYGEDLFHSV